MPATEALTPRELRVLEAVVQIYVETAEPAASRAVAGRSRLGLSSASVRNVMGELERKGYLFHPHSSAGRVPTDRAYRLYVDNLMRLAPPSDQERTALRAELTGRATAVEEILRRAAQVLGVLTQELGVAVAPALDSVVLERLDLVPVASDRLLLVFNLRSGVVRTIFVQVPGSMPREVVQQVTRLLNERLGDTPCRRFGRPSRNASATPAPAGATGICSTSSSPGVKRSSIWAANPRAWCWGARRCWPTSRSSPRIPECGS